MPEMLVGTVTDNNGLVINVWATESGGDTTFRTAVASGYTEFRYQQDADGEWPSEY
jgi:hypothetical protein